MRHFKRLWPFVMPYRRYMVGSILLAIPLAALRMSPAPLVKALVDELLVAKNRDALWIFPLGFIGLYVLNFGVRFFHYYWHRIVITRVNQDLKNRLFSHLMSLSADYFTKSSTGQLISRLGSDPVLIDNGLSTLQVAIREPVSFLFLFGYCLTLNWQLTVVTLLVFPPLGWIFSATGRNLKRYIHSITHENGQLFSTVQESLTGIRVVKSFGLEKYVREKFERQSKRFADLLLKTAVLEEVSHPLVELITSFLIAGVIYVGGSQIVSGEMSSGDLIAFFTAFALMIHPLRLLNDVSLKISTADAAAQRLFEVLDWQPTLKESVGARDLTEFHEGIELKNVQFAYPDEPSRGILHGISLSVKRGQAIALVGQSGAGKSSLVSLLPRLYDVSGGSVLVDGIDVKDYRLESLRTQIAVVSQDVFLFNDTIEENIRCGRLGATSEQIREAARKAHAIDFIEKQPQGFGAVIGDRGMKLSGGERQRISIARAFLRDAPILILDEATSSLDNASERAVQEALELLMKDRTTIIIAHRLSTIRNVDRIFVLKDGKVVESGSHQELVAAHGEYHRLYELGAAQ